MYLHDQFTLLGATPVRFKRVDKYEGLKSRSVRVSGLFADVLLALVPFLRYWVGNDDPSPTSDLFLDPSLLSAPPALSLFCRYGG